MMRPSILVSVILVLAASMLTYAAPYGPPQTFPDIYRRSPASLFDRESYYDKRGFLEPRAVGARRARSKASSAL